MHRAGRIRKAATIVIGAGGHVEADSIVASWFADHVCRAALIRPDNYVYGVASSGADIARMADGLAHICAPPDTCTKKR